MSAFMSNFTRDFLVVVFGGSFVVLGFWVCPSFPFSLALAWLQSGFLVDRRPQAPRFRAGRWQASCGLV